jgi:hypothetical protein
MMHMKSTAQDALPQLRHLADNAIIERFLRDNKGRHSKHVSLWASAVRDSFKVNLSPSTKREYKSHCEIRALPAICGHRFNPPGCELSQGVGDNG